MADGFDKLLIEGMGFFVAFLFFFSLGQKQGALDFRVVEFGIGVAKLFAEDKAFESFDKSFISLERLLVKNFSKRNERLVKSFNTRGRDKTFKKVTCCL